MSAEKAWTINQAAMKSDAEFNPEQPDRPVSHAKVGDSYTVISRFEDDVWDFSCEASRFPNNVRNYKRRLNFETLPACFRTAAKIMVLRADLSRTKPSSTIYGDFNALKPFLRYVERLGVTQTSKIKPVHCLNYVKESKEEISAKGKPLAKSSLILRFLAVEKLFKHLRGTPYAFDHPWPDSSANHQAGMTGEGGSRGAGHAKTAVIPDEDMKTLMQWAKGILDRAPQILDLRDQKDSIKSGGFRYSGGAQDYNTAKHLRRFASVLKANGYPSHTAFDYAVAGIPVACGVIISGFSGIRQHELGYIRNDAYRVVDDEDEVMYFLKSFSSKTGAGLTEWLVPELVKTALDIQKRYVQGLQDALSAEVNKLRETDPSNPAISQKADNCDMLFLTRHKSSGEVNPLSQDSFDKRLKKLSAKLGLSITLASHMFRRTFAVYVARHELGDLRYLKQHFKHWGMDMTLHYAWDDELFNEIADARATHVKSLWSEVLNPSHPISGGTAGNIRNLRDRKTETARLFKDHKTMIESVSPTVPLRATPHSFCTSDRDNCMGSTRIDMTRCGGCSESIISRDRHGKHWIENYAHLIELKDVTDIQLFVDKVERDLLWTENVLRELELLEQAQQIIEQRRAG